MYLVQYGYLRKLVILDPRNLGAQTTSFFWGFLYEDWGLKLRDPYENNIVKKDAEAFWTVRKKNKFKVTS